MMGFFKNKQLDHATKVLFSLGVQIGGCKDLVRPQVWHHDNPQLLNPGVLLDRRHLRILEMSAWSSHCRSCSAEPSSASGHPGRGPEMDGAKWIKT